MCLDFDLAAQGDTQAEAKLKLEAQIREYVYDALAGEDQAYAQQLLLRKAPWFWWVRFYWETLAATLLRKQNAHPFSEHVPLVPAYSSFS